MWGELHEKDLMNYVIQIDPLIRPRRLIMNTKKKFYIVSALIAAAVIDCSPAIADLNPPTATKTELHSSIPAFNQIADATNTTIPSIDLPNSFTNLVGHWGRYIDGEISKTDQCYFGELNADGVGTYFEISGGNYIEGTYRVESEDIDSTKVVFLINGDPNTLMRSFKLTRFISHPFADGLAEYQYMDSQTEPDNWLPVVKKYKYE
jgi:hypothetical protein